MLSPTLGLRFSFHFVRRSVEVEFYALSKKCNYISSNFVRAHIILVKEYTCGPTMTVPQFKYFVQMYGLVSSVMRANTDLTSCCHRLCLSSSILLAAFMPKSGLLYEEVKLKKCSRERRVRGRTHGPSCPSDMSSRSEM